MTSPGGRGAFIVFEGGDRCGKSTQSKMLAEYLDSHGVPTELWRFPDRTSPTGRMISSYLEGTTEADDAAIHLLFSSNRWEKRQALLSKLSQGITLVVDRYAHSGAAYTAAKRIPGLDLAWCQAPDSGLPAPDLLLYLSLSQEAAAARAGFGGERYEKQEFQSKVVQCFQAMQDQRWNVVDASQSVEAIHHQVVAQAQAAVTSCHAGAPLLRLWDFSAYDVKEAAA